MATEEDYGFDLSCVDDLDPGFKLVNGRRVLAESLCRRITMDPGSAIDCPTDGIDVRDFLGDTADEETLSQVAAQAKAEMLKDDRVSTLVVKADIEGALTNDKTLVLTCIVTDEDGPFPLTLLVSALTSKLLLDDAA